MDVLAASPARTHRSPATRPATTKSLIGKEIKGILAGSLQSSPAILAIAAWPNPSGPWAEPTDSRGRS